MQVNSEHFEEHSDAFVNELLTLLEKYQFHDNKSRFSINTNGFRIQVDSLKDCPQECVRSKTEIGSDGKKRKIFWCDPNCP